MRQEDFNSPGGVETHDFSWNYPAKQLLLLRLNEATAQLASARRNVQRLRESEAEMAQSGPCEDWDNEEYPIEKCIDNLQCKIACAEQRIDRLKGCLEHITAKEMPWSDEIARRLKEALVSLNPFDEIELVKDTRAHRVLACA